MTHAEKKHLERAARFDRSSEAQHYRMARLNLITPIIICWNTAHLGGAVRQRQHTGLTVGPEFLAHISPLGWGHFCSLATPVTKALIAILAYDSAPYPNRTLIGRLSLSKVLFAVLRR